MSNSPLATYRHISPNQSGRRNHVIDTISIHCTAGQMTAKRVVDYLANPSVQASCNYAVGYDGSIAIGVDEKDRSWCTSSGSNDHRAITIEVSSDAYHPYAVSDAAMKSLIKLLVDICERNDIPELRWKNDKSLIGQVSKQNMTVHRWFAPKDCPGEYLMNRHTWIANQVNSILEEHRGFEDVEEDAWYVEAVEWARDNGITSGTGDNKFSPNATCTRAEAVTMLWRLAGSPEPKSVRVFDDVSPADWYFKPVLFAVEKDITAGVDNNHFAPDKICSRAEMVMFLWRYYGSVRENGKDFVDVASDDYFYNAVQWASANRITVGTDANHFSPDKSCTRAEAVSMIKRAREAKNERS